MIYSPATASLREDGCTGHFLLEFSQISTSPTSSAIRAEGRQCPLEWSIVTDASWSVQAPFKWNFGHSSPDTCFNTTRINSRIHFRGNNCLFINFQTTKEHATCIKDLNDWKKKHLDRPMVQGDQRVKSGLENSWFRMKRHLINLTNWCRWWCGCSKKEPRPEEGKKKRHKFQQGPPLPLESPSNALRVGLKMRECKGYHTQSIKKELSVHNLNLGKFIVEKL